MAPSKKATLLKLATLLSLATPLLPAQAAAWKLPHFGTDAKTLYAEASAPTPPEGADAMILDDEEDYHFEADGTAVRHQYLVYKVLGQNAADDWSQISQDWAPWHEDRPVLHARAVRSDGTAYELDPKTIVDAPAAQEADDMYSDQRVLRAPLPGVSQGSVVEQEIVTRTRPMFANAGYSASIYIGRGVKVEHTRISVDAPEGMPLHYKLLLLPNLKPQETVADGRRQLVFDIDATDPWKDLESHLPSDVAAYPSISLTTTASWHDVATQYADIVESRIGTGDLHSLVDGVIKGKTDRREQIEALVAFLHADVRYTGVEFGEAAIVPRPPEESLKSKYGDCKDKATLLVAMLRAAGIPAQVALLNVGSRMDLSADLPAADFFDHAIVHVPGPPELWIDATAQYNRVGTLPQADQGRHALIVDKNSETLARIPESSSSDNVLSENREIDLADYGPARIVETSHPHGTFEALYRDLYADDKSKDTLRKLGDYVQSQYLADTLDHMDRSDPKDLNQPFELHLESDHARRGLTDLDSAIAVIRPDGMFSNLPREMREHAGKSAKDADGHDTRTADYQLPQAFTVEWQYKIVPPANFQASVVPKDQTLKFGPAVLTEHFSAEANGVVLGDLRFDTTKRRLSSAEMSAMREGIAQFREGEPIAVRFQPMGQALMDQGKVRESLQSYREAIAQQPGAAVPHLRLANALLAGGLGEAARTEARAAVKLDPRSALAQATLANILEYDLVGRQWHPGGDYSGAAAALRAAEKLDASNKNYIGDLAILLEHNDDGVRYGSGSHLDEAVAEYRKLTPDELADQGIAANPAYALFYAGRFADAQKAADALAKPPLALNVACQGALSGADAALSRAHQSGGDDEQSKQALRTAGDMLRKLRLYPIAADLLQAGASGDDAVRTMNTAAILRKTTRHEDIHYGDDPAGIVMQYFSILLTDPHLSDRSFDALLSRNAKLTEAGPADQAMSQDTARLMRAALTRSSLSADVVLDVFPQLLTKRLNGDDDSGYREILQVPGNSSMTFFIVREGSHYRLLAEGSDMAAVGLEVLDRLAAGKPAAARTLLDWARDQQHLVGGDDPLAGQAFPRFWTKGQDADAQRMKMAAAALLVQNRRTAGQGIQLLSPAAGTATTEAERLNIELALLSAYEKLDDHGKLEDVAAKLAKTNPESERVFKAQSQALQALGRLDEADELARRRLARIPDDLSAIRELASSATIKGDYKSAYERIHKLVDEGSAGSSEFNQLAWYSLYFKLSGGPDIDSALKATELSQNSPESLHTLASVYAASGKTKEAHEILVRALDLQNLAEPSTDYWYILGQIAEQYGERGVALESYARVNKPAEAWETPDSTYQLAQGRLKVLQSVSVAAEGKPAG